MIRLREESLKTFRRVKIKNKQIILEEWVSEWRFVKILGQLIHLKRSYVARSWMRRRRESCLAFYRIRSIGPNCFLSTQIEIFIPANLAKSGLKYLYPRFWPNLEAQFLWIAVCICCLHFSLLVFVFVFRVTRCFKGDTSHWVFVL